MTPLSFHSLAKQVVAFALAILWTSNLAAQEERVVETGFNSWYATHMETAVGERLNVFGQCHIRRTDFGSAWQQRLLFLGSE